MKKKESKNLSGSFPVGFHQGNVIQYLAGLYHEVIQVITEIVQNQIDKNIHSSVIELDLDRLRLKAWDDGEGASKAEIKERIGNIAAPLKGLDKIGMKGIGNLAGIAISKEYKMITRPRGSRQPFFEVSLDRDQVINQERVEFQWQEMPPEFNPAEGKAVSTIILMKKIEKVALRKLKQLENPAEVIAEALSDVFSARIAKSNISITVKTINNKQEVMERVLPHRFPGGKKEIITIKTVKGPVVFEIYITIKPVKSPKVFVEHKGAFSFLLQNMSDIYLEISDIFSSGLLQGVIRLDFCTPNESRTGFRYNEDLNCFIEALQEFAEEYGRPFIKAATDKTRFEKYADLARNIIDLAESLFSTSPDLLPEELVGLVTSGHQNSDEVQAESVKRRRREKVEREDEEELTLKGARKKVGAEKEILHSSAPSPDGIPRRRVRGQKGLTFCFGAPDEESGFNWRIRLGEKGKEKGKIIFNIAHSDWRKAEDANKKHLAQYMRLLVVRLFSETRAPEGMAENFAMVFDDEFLRYLSILAG